MTDPLPPQQSLDQPTGDEPEVYVERGSALSGWIMTKVRDWRTQRDNKHRKKWDEYVRIWRGEWAEEDKNRKSERSRIITPASMQALDATVAEIEEAMFRREAWFDCEEDLAEMEDPQQRDEILTARDMLLELAEEERIPAAVSKILLIGGLYGTGLGKINTYVKSIPTLKVGEDGIRKVVTTEEARVELIPIEPYEFVPDPTTDDIDLMLGMAHETIVPLHLVEEDMESGKFRKCNLGPWTPAGDDPIGQASGLYTIEGAEKTGAKITEWHGKVPAGMLATYMNPDDAFIAELADGDESLVEAIVTIGNEDKVLAAKPNPFVMQDRSFVAYQHDTIPGYFWGRGVIEKAYNAQKSLDANIRARHDAIALLSNPMMAGDITRLPKGMNLSVWPGKFWPTTGNPADIIQGFSLGQVSPDLFADASDMERMVQTATGAMDPGATYGAATGAQDRALMGAAFIKRSRRTVMNVERNLMQPLVQKLMWRYVQFSPNFPKDYKFTVRGTLGVMAREIEQQQDTQLLSLVPNESKPFMALVKTIFSARSGTHKAEVLKALDEHLNPSEEQKQQQAAQMALQLRGVTAEVEEKEAKAKKALAEAKKADAEAQLAVAQIPVMQIEAQAGMVKAQTDVREVEEFARQNDISEQGLGMKSFDLALRAMKLPAEVDKLQAEAADIRRGAKGE